jgi:antitoxin (DNA-binding transcriptional repressor) of toxin-antitoxin stability system
MPTYTIHAAKTNLSKLVARGKDPVARLVAIAPRPKRKFGRLKGKGSVGPEFFEPLPEDELKRWE